MGKKHKTPKTKMRSYGGGEKLPIVKSKQGLFKKPEFYLADQKYDNLGHGVFEGQYTGKLEGPSQRAIKGKGKKAKNVKVHSQGGDPIFLQDTSPMQKIKFGRKKNKKEGKTKLTQRERELRDFHTTGDPDYSYYDLGEAELNNPIKRISPMQDNGKVGAEYYNKENQKKLKQKYKPLDKKEAKEKGVGYRSEKKIERQAKRDEKKAYRQTEEGKAERRAKATDIVQSVGRSLAAAAGKDIKAPETTKTEEYEEGKRIDLSSGDDITEPKATTAFENDPGDNIVTDTTPISEEFRKANPGESKADYTKAVKEWEASKTSPGKRRDLQNISAMMKKIKNPPKGYVYIRKTNR